MISQKAKYAFKALIHLATYPGQTVQIDDIARATGVPRKFLEHILLDLKGHGLITSRRGRSGGYAMLRPPAEITVGAVLRLIDGPIAPLACISVNAYRRCDDCLDEAACAVRHLFTDVYSVILQVMDATTLAVVLRGDATRIKHVFSVV
ncbi:Rrf2 family transcriptional regulator [Oleomonas cavernae]|uniref:Rrf2 family transcriptional regulator n=1 Tax=Oleomonas cavernae TaxID=2320859 RepID=A0A418WC24_9PROT|nr:Rrf2 family transcriptional regulator [Oleomonas cavernae]RJF87559.1 Rrf2 family transcriptional regulator [Oleomonas cavernae]